MERIITYLVSISLILSEVKNHTKLTVLINFQPMIISNSSYIEASVIQYTSIVLEKTKKISGEIEKEKKKRERERGRGREREGGKGI